MYSKIAQNNIIIIILCDIRVHTAARKQNKKKNFCNYIYILWGKRFTYKELKSYAH